MMTVQINRQIWLDGIKYEKGERADLVDLDAKSLIASGIATKIPPSMNRKVPSVVGLKRVI